jgi:hypothetical protein
MFTYRLNDFQLDYENLKIKKPSSGAKKST